MRRNDAVEIARHGAQAIHRRNSAVLKVLDLLQYRIGIAGNENVTRQEQHRQAVDVGRRCGGDEIGTAGADGGGDGHQAAAEMSFGEGRGRQRHGLFVVGAEGREPLAFGVQGFAESCHVAMPEDGPHAAEQRRDAGGGGNFLCCQEAHQRLGHSQSNRCHVVFSRITVLNVVSAGGRFRRRSVLVG